MSFLFLLVKALILELLKEGLWTPVFSFVIFAYLGVNYEYSWRNTDNPFGAFIGYTVPVFVLYWLIQWPIHWLYLLTLPKKMDAASLPGQPPDEPNILSMPLPPSQRHHPLFPPLEEPRALPSTPRVGSVQEYKPSSHKISAPYSPVASPSTSQLRLMQLFKPSSHKASASSRPDASLGPNAPEISLSLVPIVNIFAAPESPTPTPPILQQPVGTEQQIQTASSPAPESTESSIIFRVPDPPDSDFDDWEIGEINVEQAEDSKEWAYTLTPIQFSGLMRMRLQFAKVRSAHESQIQSLAKTNKYLKTSVRLLDKSVERRIAETSASSGIVSRLEGELRIESRRRQDAEKTATDRQSQLHKNGDVSETQKWLNACEDLAHQLGIERASRAGKESHQIDLAKDLNVANERIQELEIDAFSKADYIEILESKVKKAEKSEDRRMAKVQELLKRATNAEQVLEERTQSSSTVLNEKKQLEAENQQLKDEVANQFTALDANTKTAEDKSASFQKDLVAAQDHSKTLQWRLDAGKAQADKDCQQHNTDRLSAETKYTEYVRSVETEFVLLRSRLEAQAGIDSEKDRQLEEARSRIQSLQSQLDERSIEDAEMADPSKSSVNDQPDYVNNWKVIKSTADQEYMFRQRVKSVETAASHVAREDARQDRNAFNASLRKKTEELNTSQLEANDLKQQLDTKSQRVIVLEHQIYGLQDAVKAYAASGNTYNAQMPGIESSSAVQVADGGRKKRRAEVDEEEEVALEATETKQARMEGASPVTKHTRGTPARDMPAISAIGLESDPLKGMIGREVGDQLEQWFGVMGTGASKQPGKIASALLTWMKFWQQDFAEVRDVCTAVAVNLTKISVEDFEDRGLMIFTYHLRELFQFFLREDFRPMWTPQKRANMAHTHQCAVQISAHAVAAGANYDSCKDPKTFYLQK